MQVILSVGELRWAEAIGRRRFNAKTSGKLDIDILGACGEMALCIALGGRYRPTFDAFHKGRDTKPDVVIDGQGYHVRTGRPDGRLLIIRRNDCDGRYVLVTGEGADYTIHGWYDVRMDRIRQLPTVDFNGRGQPCWVIQRDDLTEFTSAARL